MTESRMNFCGHDVLFGVTLATMMIPSIVTLIPTYILFRKLNWVGTYAPLIVPYFLGSAFNIFLLGQFMMTIPWHLTMAASLAVTFPLLVLFFVAQRYSIEGITLTGIKD